jgi:3-dehydroquinate synthase
MASMSERTRLHAGGAEARRPEPVEGYDVVVGHGVLDELSAMLGPDVRRVAVLSDGNLTGLSALVRVPLLSDGYEVTSVQLVPPGEASKSYAMAQSCWETLGQAGFTRSDVVVTLGGGATTDLGGFVAATWLRGVRVVHIPTTLLGMVDAAVGGKTGINTGAGKNLVGSFHEPVGVICDLDLLATLPEAELIAGLGEVVKCGFVADPEILALVEAAPADALEPRSGELRELVERAIRVKIDVVVGDLRETGGSDGHIGREMLNYGHTMAHAIEKGTDYRTRHGEAVALGMVFVAELARLTGRLDDHTAGRHAAVLAAVGLPTLLTEDRAGALGFEELLTTMRVDKKTRGSKLRFVVLDGLAQPAILADPDEDVLRSAYDHLRGVSR